MAAFFVFGCVLIQTGPTACDEMDGLKSIPIKSAEPTALYKSGKFCAVVRKVFVRDAKDIEIVLEIRCRLLIKAFFMANTYHQIYVQAIFGVKYRNAVFNKAWRSEVWGVIGNLINETGCKTIIVNGVEDHVHCFLGLKPVVSVSELMKKVKGKASKYINDEHLTKIKFEWQEGYGAFSYSHSQIDEVFKYIANQEAHHKHQTFRKEFIEYLENFEVPYDEQYIFKDLV